MSDKLYILDNKVSRNIYSLCMKEGLTKKDISFRLYGKWVPAAIGEKIKIMKKVGYLEFKEIGRNVQRKRGKYKATYKPFFDFLGSNDIVLSSNEIMYVSIIIKTKLRPEETGELDFPRMLNLIIEDAIITRLFHDVLLKRDGAYKIILPFLEKSHNASTEEIEKLKQQLREKCEKTHNKKPKRYENKAHIRCDVLFSHLLIPDILQSRLQSDLKTKDFQSVFDSIDVIRYVSEDIRT